MAILVTGANGYVGSHLIEKLKNTFQDTQIIGIDICDVNISDNAKLNEFFDEHAIDTVVHLAGVVNDKDYSPLFDANIAGLYSILDVCVKHRVKHFIFASTNNVYSFNQGAAHLEDEDAAPDIANKYGLTKYCGELLIKDVCRYSGMNYTIARIGDIYGPGQRHGNLLKILAQKIEAHDTIQIYGEGDRTRDYIYIDDVTEGFVYFIKNEVFGTYNLATGKGTSVADIARLAADFSVSGSKPEAVIVEHEDHTKVILNVERLKSKGYQAKVSFAEGFKDIVEEGKEK